jgi:hypothetical protein
VVGPINAGSTGLTATADGAAIYFEVPDGQGGFIIERIAVSDATTTTVTRASGLFGDGFVISPDAQSLAYHAPGSTFDADTIVALALPSGTRRATTVEGINTVGTFSADGTVLGIISYPASALHLWHIFTGARDTIPDLRAFVPPIDVAWSGGAFHLLYRSSDAGLRFTDTSLAGGSALTYPVEQIGTQFIWLADRAAIWTIPMNSICDSQGCNSTRYDFVYSTAATVVSVGAASGGSYYFADASPDGHWIAHAEGLKPLYLLHKPSP